MSVPLYHRAGRLALILAFSASAGSFFFAYFLRSYWETPLRYAAFAFYAPAVLLGCWSWLRVRSFAATWPVIGCTLLAFIAISWTDRTEMGRGIAVFCNMAVALPISALIVDMNYRAVCARTYLIISAAMLVFLFFLLHYPDPHLSQHVLGTVTSNGGSRTLLNRNATGTQMGLAILISIGFCLGELSRRKIRTLGSGLGVLFYVLTTLLFAFGTILTQSRMAVVAAVLPSCMLIFHSKRLTKRKIALIIILICISVLVPVTKIGGDINVVAERFKDIDELLTLHGRTEIWEEVWPILTSGPKQLLIGTGTGGVDKEIGTNSADLIGTGMGDDGIVRRGVHNAFFEWILSYGLLGVILGASALYAAIRRAWKLDRRDRSVYRRSLILFCLLVSMTSLIYRYPFWPAFGSYIFAILSYRPRKETVTPT